MLKSKTNVHACQLVISIKFSEVTQTEPKSKNKTWDGKVDCYGSIGEI